MRLVRKIGKYLLFYLLDPRNIYATERVSVTSDGIKFWCLRENQIERSIIENGFWEPLETSALKKHLKDKSVVFDIGANNGYYTLLMSQLVGEKGQVHCFEPTSYAIKRLQKNISINQTLPIQNIKINNKGLSSRNEIKEESFESRFSERLLAHQEKELIEFITLDSYYEKLNLDSIDFIKIDVDGYDYEVLLGGAEIIKKYKPIIMAEICNRVLKEHGVDIIRYLNLYLEYGYSTCELLETNEVISLDKLIKDPRIKNDAFNIILY
jgi:FkbM family methyltransferase